MSRTHTPVGEDANPKRGQSDNGAGSSDSRGRQSSKLGTRWEGWGQFENIASPVVSPSRQPGLPHVIKTRGENIKKNVQQSSQRR